MRQRPPIVDIEKAQAALNLAARRATTGAKRDRSGSFLLQEKPKAQRVSKSMGRSELVTRLVEENPGLQTSEVEAIVEAIFSEIAVALERGSSVKISGFGTFSVRKKRTTRSGRSSISGEFVLIDGKTVAASKTSK
jgi:integration host factor subunit beta